MRNCARGLDFEVRRKVMERWSRKLQRSGYPATLRHQAIREAMEKFERMCEVEDKGGRPIHRAREWQKCARRLHKEMKVVSWHTTEKGTISAPLIIDPTAGDLTTALKLACNKYKEATGIEVKVRLRAGASIS